MNIFDRHSIAPAGDRAVTAVLLKLFLCQYVPRGLMMWRISALPKVSKGIFCRICGM